MIAASPAHPTRLDAWRDAARPLLSAGVPPDAVSWDGSLFADTDELPPTGATPPRVPPDFLELAETVLRHRDAERHDLLYRALWRIANGERELLEHATDPLVLRLSLMAKAVRRDAHKMHAFLRFRPHPEEDWHLAWFEPEHRILEAEAGFFVRRFAGMRWSILTPDGSAHWDGETLEFGPPGRREDVPPEGEGEVLWRAYYGSTFNPARLKPAAMRAEMPLRYWRNLPETREIPRLMEEAPARVAAMVARGASEPSMRRQRLIHWAPSGVSEAMELFDAAAGDREAALAALKAEVLADRETPLAAQATQAVFGEGPLDPPLLFVGEQPGDEEDLKGRPFVGPAGRLFDGALEKAGITRGECYLTNAVKHFKFNPSGRRRIHQSPDAGDIAHYRPFLRREIEIVAPRLVVTLGATALRAMMGRAIPVTKARGEIMRTPEGLPVFPTVHPSYLLRLPDPDSREREYGRFVEDLKRAHREVM
ncbi:UdgX family uracil-DNA binding protein [Sabulicella rubraurantiaca]|uniref:UdgX family uracil-DNA binding protein n=1 Tax=Sabulicella rubraurantiaca TaxID=2811429 RepID=UPI001A96CAEB|nr:UdgX family uracil-DNA binding protein [Sabulicella rubraurantiaca]